jgi:prepilin-type N-terminal cleavage/methylation domain-containing protein
MNATSSIAGMARWMLLPERGDAVMNQRESTRRPARQAGFSLAELLAVLALIGITIAIGIPLVNEQLRIAEVRAAADDMGVHLRAARMLAVTRHKDIVVTVSVHPTNTFTYEGRDGLPRTIAMPGAVRIASGSTASITFHSNGSSGASSTVTVESAVPNATERWTLSVNTLGLVTVAHARV